MAGSTSGEREAMRREAAMRRERIAGALAAMREEFEPGAVAHRAARRVDWRDLRPASLVLGRTLRDNPVASVVATGSVLWLALRSRAVLERQPPRADLVLVPDRNGSDGAMPASKDPLDAPATTHADPRGRDAREPRQIPGRGWKEILSRVWTELGDDNISIVAAGVAFYALLAIFPALGAALAIYGFVADPADVSRQPQPARPKVYRQAEAARRAGSGSRTARPCRARSPPRCRRRDPSHSGAREQAPDQAHSSCRA